MILALDISTSITGLTVLDGKKIVYNEAVDTRNKNKFPNTWAKAEAVRARLLYLCEEYPDIDRVYIEKSLQMFRSGFSSAKTLATLSSFNGIVSWLCYEIFHTIPHYISATTARKLCNIKIPKGRKAKQVVLEHLIATEPQFVVDITRNGNPSPSTYDRADSLIIAMAAQEQENV